MGKSCPTGQGCPKDHACAGTGRHAGVLEGQLVDMKCHFTADADGKAHDQCAVQCAKAGMPVGLEDPASGRVYTVLSAPAGLAEWMGRKVRISGTQYCRTMAIAPQKIEVEKDGVWTEVQTAASSM
jgi:hypothetical protein